MCFCEKIQEYLVLLCFTLWCFTDVAFSPQIKGKTLLHKKKPFDLLYCTTCFFAVAWNHQSGLPVTELAGLENNWMFS